MSDEKENKPIASVVINGEVYVPLRTIRPPSLKEIERALIEEWYGECLEEQHEDLSESLRIEIIDQYDSDSPTIKEFVERLAIKLQNNN